MQVDVADLCALLECIGLKIKCVDSVGPAAEEAGTQTATGNTVTVVCNKSGLRVVLESESTVCSCPDNQDEHCSGFWQVSGVSHGVVQNNKESGSSLLGSLSEKTKNIMTRELHKLIQFSRTDANFSSIQSSKVNRCMLFSETSVHNRTSSLTDLNLTPPDDKKHLSVKVETPTRYRSLDTLTNLKHMDEELPAPGQLLAKAPSFFDNSDIVSDELPDSAKFKRMNHFKRQQTYTKSTPDKSNVMLKSKTSSPIGKLSESVLQNLLTIEKTAETLKDRLASLVKEVMAEDKPEDTSVGSLALDFSKISVAKEPMTKNKFVSSPNLSGSEIKRQDMYTTAMKRKESNSTSQLAIRKTPASQKAPSKLRRLSPNFFRKKKDEEKSPAADGSGSYKKLDDKTEKEDGKPQSKSTSQLKPRTIISGSTSGIRTPTNRAISEIASSSSATKKKMYSHVKSTIPKPTYSSKKE